MSGAFRAAGIDSPKLAAEVLLSHVLGCDRLRLAMESDRPASEDERARLRGLAARAIKHEPIQYLVGQWWFFGLPFSLDPRVLIPRPATETIVEHVLQHARANHPSDLQEPLRVADVATGSGAIAIAIAHNRKDAQVLASDISPGALEVAAINAQRHEVDSRVEFVPGDLLEPIIPRGADGFHYLLSNPPYIPDHEWDAVLPNVRDHEPHAALRGGADGLRFVRPILEQAHTLLRPGGLVLVEVAESTADNALAIAAGNRALRDPRVLKDFENRPRVVLATRVE